MSLYSQYIKEREDIDCIEVEHGYATYKKLPDGNYYIIDIYVESGFRRSGIAKELSNRIREIAQADGAIKLIGSVCLVANGVTQSLQAVLGDGFSYSHFQGNMLYFSKEI